jgi:hypothetical protein
LLCRWRCSAPGQPQLRTKFFKLGMDGLCSPQSASAGIANFGSGELGVVPGSGRIVTSVSFAGTASSCPAYPASASPHPADLTSLVTECWMGAPSAMYVALDGMCELGGTSFNKVRARMGI